MKPEQFLEKYLNHHSPTGFEAEGQKLWMDYMKPVADEWITDAYGTAVAVINPGKDYKVAIEAHVDEISWFVSYINPEGFIYVKRNGGSDHIIAPSKRVRLFGDKGEVKGVFGWPAIHTRKDGKDDPPKLTNIFIDVGASSEEEVREMGIRPGTVLIFDDGFSTLNDKWYVGRALDNRIGGYMIAQVAHQLKKAKKKLPYTLYVVNAVQEEVGLRGAQMIAERLQPNVALVTDVTHDTQSPMIDKIVEGNLAAGKGPVLMTAPSVHQQLFQQLVETARKHQVDFQYDSASRATGTDTDAFAYSHMGVPSALISLPLRYMHTTVEMVRKEDVEGVIKLMTKFLSELKAGTEYNYLK